MVIYGVYIRRMSEEIFEELSSNQKNVIQKWQEKVKRGLLRVIILRMFQEQDQDANNILLNGITIKERIKSHTTGNWDPSPGSIYPILGEMEKDGLIIEEPSENKKNRDYKLTEFGRKIYSNVVEEGMFPGGHRPGSASHFQSPAFENLIKKRYNSLRLKELKLEYERHKIVLEIIEDLLKEKIINDPEI